ncbi:MAG: YgeY family selenium metabolism-linked hydrolase [Candidatus Eisenbacteria bacterium]|nr:YgeY family selenium metabolism-linked hydrolase [Candidatus Eisenbacteria bacterium]
MAEALEADTARLLGDLIRIPSFSTEEREVVDRIRAEMERIGFDDVRIDGLGSVIGRIGDGPKTVAFDAHIDTVRTGDESLWTFDPFEGGVVDGMVRGRGASDQKGGMASMLAAARIVREIGLAKGLTLLFTGTVMEEDCDGLCWQYLVKEEGIRPDLVVITEPTDCRIYRGHRGRMEMTVRAAGLSCHGSDPTRGDNAIYKGSRIALEIEKLNTRLADDPFLGRGTICASQFFFTSPSQCAVPDSATVQVDRRLTAGEDKEKAVEELSDAAARAGVGGARVEVLRYEEKAYTGLVYGTDKYYPTWTLPEDSPWLLRAREAHREVFDAEADVGKWVFSTNGVATAGMFGIPTIGFGPGAEVYAHAPDERIPVRDLSRAAAFYAALAAKAGEA